MYSLKYFLLSVIVLLVNSCTFYNREEVLNSWLGRSVDELIMAWGPPQTTFNLSNGEKLFQYNQTKTISQEGRFETLSRGRSLNSVNIWEERREGMFIPPRIVTYQCTTRFIISNGLIKEWGQSDDECYKFKIILPNNKVYSINSDDSYCREYKKKVIINGKKQDGYGKSCLKPDGNWKVVK